MLRALEEEHAKRRTPEMELLRLCVRRLDIIWRQLVVDGGREAPDPIEVLLPGEKKPKKSLRSIAVKSMQHAGR